MRARLIKPGYFKSEELADLPWQARLLFPGLWCLADREGRLKDRPRTIKSEVLPYDDADVNALLDCLHTAGFIVRYGTGRNRYIQVVNFGKHQTPHVKEPDSLIPAPDEYQTNPMLDRSLTNPVPMIPVPMIPVNGTAEAASDDAVLPASRDEMGSGWGLLREEPTTPAPDWPDATWIDAAFDQAFWPAYPRKTHKTEARACWRKLLKRQPTYETALALAETILEVLSEQSDAWTDPRITPHAATYLNGERWTDEQVIPTGRPARSSGQPWAP